MQFVKTETLYIVRAQISGLKQDKSLNLETPNTKTQKQNFLKISDFLNCKQKIISITLS